MEINSAKGIRLSLDSITRKVTNEDGTTRLVTYRKGAPEFDAYVAESKEWKEKFSAEDSDGLPKNFMLSGIATDGTVGHKVDTKIQIVFSQYYTGNASEKDIEATLRDIVADFRTSYVNQGFDPDVFMPRLLKDVYTSARLHNIAGVGERNYKEALKMTSIYSGHDRNTRDYIYYDADLYYQSEAMKDKTIEMMQKISKEYGVSGMEFFREYEDGDIRKGIYGSYNTIVNFDGRQQYMIGSMIDETMVPPKGFKFFYKGNDSGTNNYKGIPSSDGTMESHFDGILHVWYGDWSYMGRVPVRQDATQFPISVNMYDTVAKNRSDIPAAIVPMLKNFDFYTLYLSGRYEQSHPRHY